MSITRVLVVNLQGLLHAPSRMSPFRLQMAKARRVKLAGLQRSSTLRGVGGARYSPADT